MATNYLRFSMEVPINNFHAVQEIMEGVNYIKKCIDDEEEIECPLALYTEFGQAFIKLATEELHVGFQWKLDQKSLVLYAEDSSSTELTAYFIHFLLKAGVLSVPHVLLEWTYTCSKQRPGGFGGGAVLIWDKGIEWQPNAQVWADEFLTSQTST